MVGADLVQQVWNYEKLPGAYLSSILKGWTRKNLMFFRSQNKGQRRG